MGEPSKGLFSGWLCAGTTWRDFRNSLRTLGWLLAWALAFVGGGQLLKRDLVPAGPVSWLVAALPTVLMLFALAAYIRFVREADELQRKIQLDSLALGWGGAWLATVGYALFEKIGAPPMDAATVILVMAALYSIGVVRGQLRFR